MVAERGLFVPAGAVTGIGSLPFDAVTSGIGAVQEFAAEIPFWPQLPQRSPKEGIVAQGLGVLDGLISPRESGYGYEVRDGQIDAVLQALHRSDGNLNEHYAAGFFAFEAALVAGAFPQGRAVKGQIEGPITLAAYLFYKGRPFLVEAELFAAVAFHVSQMLCWQIEKLQARGVPVLLFVDEPALCLPASPSEEERRLSALAAALQTAKARGAWAGLHCCAASPFARMGRVGADILSFDAHEGLEQFFLDGVASEFARHGGIVAYGLIPTRQSLAEEEAGAIFRRWFAMASAAGDPQLLARGSMVTATCGLGMLDASAVRESFTLAHEVSGLLRKLAG